MTKPNQDTCQTVCEHPAAICDTRDRMPLDEQTMSMAEIFKLMGDFNRLRILQALSIRELCVCDLSSLLGLSQSAISHQLRLLRTAKLVKSRKSGKNVFYSLDDDHVRMILDMSQAHVRGECHKPGEKT